MQVRRSPRPRRSPVPLEANRTCPMRTGRAAGERREGHLPGMLHLDRRGGSAAVKICACISPPTVGRVVGARGYRRTPGFHDAAQAIGCWQQGHACGVTSGAGITANHEDGKNDVGSHSWTWNRAPLRPVRRRFRFALGRSASGAPAPGCSAERRDCRLRRLAGRARRQRPLR